MNEEDIEVDDEFLAIEKLGNPALFQDDFVMPSEILDDMNFPNDGVENFLMDHDYVTVPNAATLPNAGNEEHLNINIPNEVSDETVEAFLRDHDYNPYIDAENPLPTPSTQEAPHWERLC